MKGEEIKRNAGKTVVIIGGGLGGLFTGAILSKEGFRVTVLEKNATVGGGLQTFRRFGVSFDTGMHVIAGMQPGGNIRRICQYLGIFDQVKIMDVDDDCTDFIYFAEDQKGYRIRKGQQGFVDSLAADFPEEREHLKSYVEALFRITESLDLFCLRPSSSMMTVHSGDFFMSAEALIAKYIDNLKLRSVLAYMNPLYGGKHDETPAFVHAVISVLYINGASRFVGGSDRLAQLLVSLIEKAGGEVITHDGVEWIEVNNRHVEEVRTQKGKVYQADYYISDIHPCTMLRLMPEKAFPKAYRERLNEIPNSYSAFSVYIKLKPNSFPYINHSEYYMTKYEDIWKFGEPVEDWPMGFLMMTSPEENQGRYADKILVTAPMLFDEVKAWENTTVGHRGEAYEHWKKKMANRLLDKMEELHPGFRDCIDQMNTASPLTIRDFYGVKEGSLTGFSKDCHNMALSQVPVVTKIDNLLLTGQNNNLHGFCGVPLTAINTCEAILGRNYVINSILASEKERIINNEHL